MTLNQANGVEKSDYNEITGTQSDAGALAGAVWNAPETYNILKTLNNTDYKSTKPDVIAMLSDFELFDSGKQRADVRGRNCSRGC